MSNGENLTLQRLLNRRDATALLQSMEASVADLALALVRNDGSVFVSTTNWAHTQADAQHILRSLDAEQVTRIDHWRLYPLAAGAHLLGAMVVFDQMPARSQSLERALHHSLNIMLTEALEKRDVAAEALERYREINLMYRVSETIGTLLDVDKIPGVVLEESKRAIRAEAGAIFLAAQDAGWQDHAGFCLDEGPRAFSQIAPGALGQVWQSDCPAIVTDYPDDVGYSSILYAPLKTQEHVLGGIVLGRARGQSIFTASDEKLLMSVARQAAVAVENARLHQQVLDKERLEHELQLARNVQASLIPSQTPKIPGWDFAAYWNPAREVAGDFYDFIANVGARGSSSLHGIVLADVSDKGMHAALFMALTRSVLRAATTAGQLPAASVTQSNRLLCADSTGGMFVTLFYAQLDPAKNEMTYVNAGHNPPFLFRAKEKTIEELDRTGIMLGFDEQVRFEQRVVQFRPGDFIVFYTDGVTEAFNSADEQFGEERLLELIRAGAEQSPDEMLQTLRRQLTDFVGERAQSDDITIVIAKCFGSER